MTVWSIANGPGWHTAETDLIQEEPVTGRLEARVEKVRGVGEAGSRSVCGIALAEESLYDVHDSAEEMGAARERGRADRAKDGAFRYADIYKRVEAVVYNYIRIVDRKEEVSAWRKEFQSR